MYSKTSRPGTQWFTPLWLGPTGVDHMSQVEVTFYHMTKLCYQEAFGNPVPRQHLCNTRIS